MTPIVAEQITESLDSPQSQDHASKTMRAALAELRRRRLSPMEMIGDSLRESIDDLFDVMESLEDLHDLQADLLNTQVVRIKALELLLEKSK